jgi:hypothetical protein
MERARRAPERCARPISRLHKKEPHHADPTRTPVPCHARRTGGRGHPAQVRALRLLHGHLPHLPAAGRRAGRAARPHLPDQAGAGGRDAHARHPAAPGPLPDLPQLRKHLPQRRAIRPPGGHRPQDRRGAGAQAAGRARHALGAQGRHELGAVRARPQAGPVRTRPAARSPGREGAAVPGGRRLARARACAQGAAAGRLRAAGHDAAHQLRNGARAGRGRHTNRGRAPGRLLRRREIPPQRPGRRQGADARQHRCLVAAAARWRPSS